ncbi:hypothetical protein KJY77_02120 [Canibacter sp. lx-72]|uniref:murein biosynthesis integral membrane protein MurJ n=1 Tax=Canibacter zhuwentaonis TaxID=2837491 RepID=UPI001BDCB8A5|nr:lipid II flippase MurJ [Canibacter zhuwentaonis]MBT1017939.1 hypothetical protein [Canibacter zhuwentaonis]
MAKSSILSAMSRSSFSRASIMIAGGTMLSRVLGLIRQMLMVFAIGSLGFSANAYVTAGRVPYLIYTLVISGALTAVLVPQITKAAMAKDRGQAYIQKLLTVTVVAGAVLTIACALIAPVLIATMTPGWSAEHRQLAVYFALWLTPQVFFFALYTVVGEVLNARSLFGPYAWTPALNNAFHITGLLVFCWVFGSDPDGTASMARWNTLGQFLVAGTATLGVASQALVLFLFFKRADIKFRFDFNWRGVGLSDASKIASWTLGSVALAQILGLYQAAAMNRASASEIGLAASEFAQLIFILPHAIIVVSVVMASFTRMSENANAGDFTALKHALSRTLTLTISSTAICAAVLAVLSLEISRILQPTALPNTVANVALMLFITVLGLTPFSTLYVLNRGFFALSNTRTPFFVNLVHTICTAIFTATTFLWPSKYTAILITLSYAVSCVAQAGATFMLLRELIGSIGGKAITHNICKTLAATAVSVICGLLTLLGMRLRLSPDTIPAATNEYDLSILSTVTFTPALISAGAVTAVMFASYAVALLALRHPLATAAKEKITARFKR